MAKRASRRTSGIKLEASDAELFHRAKNAGPHAACFFNNKGGVGKTTLVANLSAELAINFGAKVLVIDADPQCNLTQYVLEDKESVEIYTNSDPQSIYSVIRPLALGKGYGFDLPIRSAKNFGFDIIVGDPRLAIQEDLLANDWRDARGGGMRGIRTTFVFADVVTKAKRLGYDCVFFDMGPSLGAINRSVLLAMDFFVVPMSIDIFSSWAIKNIGGAVTQWQKELRTGIGLAEDPKEIPNIEPSRRLQFIGYVTQQHKERLKESLEVSFDPNGKDILDIEVTSDMKIVQAYQNINKAFPQQIKDNLRDFYEEEYIDPHLGNIRHLASLAPMSQSQHTPMISVSGRGSYAQLRKQAREIYRRIAVRYLDNLNKSRGVA